MKKSELLALVQELTTPKYRVTGSYEFGMKLVKEIGNFNQEHYVLIVLDAQNKILEQKTLNIGCVNHALVDFAELTRTIISHPTGISFITAHNHPSGSLEPSPADNNIRIRIKEIAELFNFNYIDDLIVTQTEYWSAEEKNQM